MRSGLKTLSKRLVPSLRRSAAASTRQGRSLVIQNAAALSTLAPGNKQVGPFTSAVMGGGFDDIFRLDPFFSRDPFFQDMLRSMERPFFARPTTFTDSIRRMSPGYEIHETDTEYHIAMDVPGVKTEDITLQVEGEGDGQVLHLSGTRKKTDKDGKIVETAKFEKYFSIGDGVDKEKITADLSNGVLTVKAPKLEKVEMEPIKIAITEGKTTETPMLEEGAADNVEVTVEEERPVAA